MKLLRQKREEIPVSGVVLDAGDRAWRKLLFVVAGEEDTDREGDGKGGGEPDGVYVVNVTKKAFCLSLSTYPTFTTPGGPEWFDFILHTNI